MMGMNRREFGKVVGGAVLAVVCPALEGPVAGDEQRPAATAITPAATADSLAKHGLYIDGVRMGNLNSFSVYAPLLHWPDLGATGIHGQMSFCLAGAVDSGLKVGGRHAFAVRYEAVCWEMDGMVTAVEYFNGGTTVEIRVGDDLQVYTRCDN